MRACRRMTVAENLVSPGIRSATLRDRQVVPEPSCDARGGASADRPISDRRPPGRDASAEVLSGGNVQRMVLARELSGPVEVLIAANPCFGLDVASTAEIRAQIMEVRNRGAAVLLVSEDLDELFELCGSDVRDVLGADRLRNSGCRWLIAQPLGATWSAIDLPKEAGIHEIPGGGGPHHRYECYAA